MSTPSGHIPDRQQTTCTNPIVPTLPPTRCEWATHPFAQYCCGILLWLVEFIGACRPYFTVCFYQVPDFFTQAVTYATCIIMNLSLCCFFHVLLCVIQPCHCSSRARHSALTAATGSVLCTCGRSPLYSQYYSKQWCLLLFSAYVYVCLSNFRTFANFSLRTSTFMQNSEYADT